MTRIARGLALLASVAASACYTGPSAGSFPPATSGHGVESTIHLEHTRLAGELLDASDSGYVVLSERAIFYTPYSAVKSASFSGVGSHREGRPEAELLERLRLVSRFPKGITPAMIQALLADLRQTKVEVVTQ